MMDAQPQCSEANRGSLAILWAGWLLGPLAWALHENVSCVLVWHVCGEGDPALQLGVTLATLAVAACGCAMGLLALRRLPAGDATHHHVRRARFLGIGGAALSAISLLGIAIGSIPMLLLDPCAGIP
ncbi:hypothetical protein [Falsiroseomonas sp.]|uniref:hypothetical protein n=1 Tax=Falsiroseomonas sp. TaxID=2870721 RepID=UPI00356A74C4